MIERRKPKNLVELNSMNTDREQDLEEFKKFQKKNKKSKVEV